MIVLCTKVAIFLLTVTAPSSAVIVSSSSSANSVALTPREKRSVATALARWPLLGRTPSSRRLHQSDGAGAAGTNDSSLLSARVFVRNFLSEDLWNGAGAVYGANGSPVDVPSTVAAGTEAAFLATGAGNAQGVSGTAFWQVGSGRGAPALAVVMWSVPWTKVFRSNYLAVGLSASQIDAAEAFLDMYYEQVSSDCTMCQTCCVSGLMFDSPHGSPGSTLAGRTCGSGEATSSSMDRLFLLKSRASCQRTQSQWCL